MAKQPQKHRTSLTREETAAKRQLCEEALYQNDLVKSFEYEINTKEVQTELQCNSVCSMTSPEVVLVSTQVSHIDLTIMNDVVTQCDIEPLDCIDKVDKSQPDYESSDESEYHQSESEYDDNSSSDAYSEYTFENCFCCILVVFNTSVKKLLNLCLSCNY